ncbi:MAG TPA: amylo-alpha-1,6-glucosidase, partial [Nitrolancea sp.]|nr:amylo-alpha-1,6-glucosidase [Nitrolancea sp.]
LRRYGADDAFARLFNDLLDAVPHFNYLRLPELFCGFQRDAERVSIPVAYPVSCSPQAWASGTIPFLLTALLGVEPDATRRQLRLRPHLPAWLPEVRLDGLRFAGQTVDLVLRGNGADVELSAQASGDVDVCLLG